MPETPDSEASSVLSSQGCGEGERGEPVPSEGTPQVRQGELLMQPVIDAYKNGQPGLKRFAVEQALNRLLQQQADRFLAIMRYASIIDPTDADTALTPERGQKLISAYLDQTFNP